MTNMNLIKSNPVKCKKKSLIEIHVGCPVHLRDDGYIHPVPKYAKFGEGWKNAFITIGNNSN